MATDLFGKYFNNPTKSYIYTNMLCNGESADEMSFDIVGSDGVISNNEDMLAKIDLSEVHVGLTQYTTDMKIINPYGIIYVKGIAQGESYTTKAYGVVTENVLAIDDWMYRTTMILHIKYVNETGMKVIKCVIGSGSVYDDKTFIESSQELFDKERIPINITYENGYVYFTSTVLGFDFWISHIDLWHYLGDGNIEDDFPELFENDRPSADESNDLGFGYDGEWSTSQANYYNAGTVDSVNSYTTVMSEEQYREIYGVLGMNSISDSDTEFGEIFDVSTNILFNTYLFEDLTKYLPAIKYRNGAMKGCLVLAIYPKFNAENIPETQRSLKIGHLVDRVEEYYTSLHNEYNRIPLYVRVVRDVVDSYYSQYEYDVFKKWSNAYSHMNVNDGWLDPEEIPIAPLDKHTKPENEWQHSHVPNEYVLNSIYKDEAIYDAIGLFGYATYLSKHNGWLPMGQIYLRTSVEDDESAKVKNLISSFIIYNPNPFPVTVKYMTFV